MLCGTAAVGAAVGLFYFFLRNQEAINSFKKVHPVLFMYGVFTAAGFVVYLFGSVVIFMLGILLPLLRKLLHCSFLVKLLSIIIIE